MSVDIADRMALLDLHARSARAIDSGDSLAWAECFTEDGVLRTSRPREVRGRSALTAFAAEWHASLSAQRRHVTWHHLVDAEDDELVGTCYAAILRTTPAGVEAEFTAVYRDRFVRVDDAWRLRERDVEIDSAPDEPAG
jgi:3-phenylpropionate/cinnamic acid dioxygenase small subunit